MRKNTKILTKMLIKNKYHNIIKMLIIGVHFDTSTDSLVKEITTAIRVFAHGVEDFVNDPKNINETLTTQLSCEGEGESRWVTGDKFYKLVY